MAVTTFIPELWNARLLYNLEKAHVATAFVNKDYEGEIKNVGDTVHINTLGGVTIKTYTANSDMAAADDLATTDQTLVIDQAKYFNFQLDDVDAAQVAGDVMDTAMGRASYALADVSDAFLFGKLAAGGASANYVGSAASPIQLTAANIYSTLVELRTKLDKQNVPTAGRKINVSPEVYAVLLQCQQFITLNAGVAETAVVNGLVGKIAGFDVYETNNAVFTTGGSKDYWTLTATVDTATTFAEQIIKTEAYRPEKRFADAVKGLHVYGAKVVRPEEIATLFCYV